MIVTAGYLIPLQNLIIREDLRDISRIPELARIETLAALLPEQVGSLFSINSLVQYLEVSQATVKTWLEYLKELYFLFDRKRRSSLASR